MDYEQMSVQELREACQARGLGTARSRVDLIQRLTDHDTQPAPPPADAPKGHAEAPPSSVAGVFRQSFPAEPGGPDEETHLANREATLAAAAEAGFQTRGDARLALASGNTWVYEVLVRQADRS